MKKIEAYIQPFMLRKVEEALRAVHVHGMTMIAAQGFGREKDEHFPHHAADYAVEFIPKTKVEIVCPDAQCAELVRAIREAAHTGRQGDGKIIVFTVETAVSIRTGEEGETVI